MAKIAFRKHPRDAGRLSGGDPGSDDGRRAGRGGPLRRRLLWCVRIGAPLIALVVVVVFLLLPDSGSRRGPLPNLPLPSASEAGTRGDAKVYMPAESTMPQQWLDEARTAWAAKDWEEAEKKLALALAADAGEMIVAEARELVRGIEAYKSEATGWIRLAISPAEAVCFLNGEEVEDPGRVGVRGIGEHVLTVVKPRYETKTVVARLRQPGEEIELPDVRLAPSAELLAEHERQLKEVEAEAERLRQAARDAEREREELTAHVMELTRKDAEARDRLSDGPSAAALEPHPGKWKMVEQVAPEHGGWRIEWELQMTKDSGLYVFEGNKVKVDGKPATWGERATTTVMRMTPGDGKLAGNRREVNHRGRVQQALVEIELADQGTSFVGRHIEEGKVKCVLNGEIVR